MNPDFRKEQTNPDGVEGHEEREKIYRRRKKIDVKRTKRKFTGNKHLRKKIHDYIPRRFADPTSGFSNPAPTRARPTTCPQYKPGCTYANCDGCKRIFELKKTEVSK